MQRHPARSDQRPTTQRNRHGARSCGGCRPPPGLWLSMLACWRRTSAIRPSAGVDAARLRPPCKRGGASGPASRHPGA
eukprot:9646050-Alexandrium_andersonii.AAC.1